MTHMLSRAVFCSVLLLSCSGPPSPPGEPPKSASSTSAPTDTPGKTREEKDASPKKGEKRKLSSAEKQGLKEYRKAMKEGREATRAKKFTIALAAFDRAIKARPDNVARAVSERGYAYLLADDLEKAAADLDRAADLTQDKKILGQIWYNRGLLATKRGDESAARRAFSTSNEFNPAKAAKKKLAGLTTKPCSVEVEKPDQDDYDAPYFHASPKPFSDWLALYRALKKESYQLQEKQAPPDADAARAVLCEDGDCKDPGPYLIDYGEYQALVFLQKDNSLLVFKEFTESGSARCGRWGTEAEIVNSNPLQLKVTYTEPGMPAYVCFDGEGNEIPEDQDLPEDGECQSGCLEEESISYSMLFFQGEKLALPISYEEESLRFERSGDSVEVIGADCQETIPLP